MRIKDIRKNPILDSILESCFMKKLEENLSYKELKEYWDLSLKKLGMDPKKCTFPSKSTFLKAYKEHLKNLGFQECELCGKMIKTVYREYLFGELKKLCRNCWEEVIKYKGSTEYLTKILREGIVRE